MLSHPIHNPALARPLRNACQVWQPLPALRIVQLVRCTGGKLQLGRAMAVATNILRGLAHLHSAGIIMLDLKPGNVLVQDDGSAVLTDFGISKVISNTLGAAHTSLCGTYSYM